MSSGTDNKHCTTFVTAGEGPTYRGSSFELASHKIKGGLKLDNEKPPMDLLPSEALEQIAKVLGFGALKYERNNWRKGIEYGRLHAAALRHLTAWNNGEDTDPDSGLSHVAHAACNLMFLLEFIKYRPDLDNRYKRGKMGHDDSNNTSNTNSNL